MFISSLSPKYILKVQNKKNAKCALNFRRTIVFVSTLNNNNIPRCVAVCSVICCPYFPPHCADISVCPEILSS